MLLSTLSTVTVLLVVAVVWYIVSLYRDIFG